MKKISQPIKAYRVLYTYDILECKVPNYSELAFGVNEDDALANFKRKHENAEVLSVEQVSIKALSASPF